MSKGQFYWYHPTKMDHTNDFINRTPLTSHVPYQTPHTSSLWVFAAALSSRVSLFIPMSLEQREVRGLVQGLWVTTQNTRLQAHTGRLRPHHTSPQRLAMLLGLPGGQRGVGESSGPGVRAPRFKDLGQVALPLWTSVSPAVNERLVWALGSLSVWLFHKWFWVNGGKKKVDLKLILYSK